MHNQYKTITTLVSDAILKDAACSLGFMKQDGVVTVEIHEKLQSMSPKEIFNAYCRWNGFIGSWGNILWTTVEALMKSEVRK